MYAVIKAGGKQQKVKTGDVIEVEHVRGGDDSVEFHPILVVDDDGTTHFGKDAQKAVVVAKLVSEQKGDKVKVFKYRPKTGYARKQGHRQMVTLLEIQDIRFGARRSRKKEEASASDEKPAAKQASTEEPPQAESAPEVAEKPAPKTRTTRSRAKPQAESAPEPRAKKK
jgi:large subunit ribosomal protein L21